MKPSLSSLLVFLFGALVALASPPARAQSTFPEDLRCPLDGHISTRDRVVATNVLGGMDSDFCPYSSSIQPREFEAVTCSLCLYSARVGRFEKKLPDLTRRALSAVLDPLRAQMGDPEALTPWQRFELAALVASVEGEDPYEIGRLYLEGAWTVRDRIVGFLPRITGPLEIWQTLNELDPQQQALKDRVRWAMALFDLHRAAHRGGFTERRDAYFRTLDGQTDLPPEIFQRQEKVRDWLEIENRYLAKAAGQFQIAMARTDITPAQKAKAEYLFGDMLRRLGRLEEALPHIRAQANNPAAPEDVQGAARQILTALGRK